MTLMYLWIYTLILIILWWFFVIAKIHSYKFKNFSNNIQNVTRILLVVMFLLSLLWYIVILMYSWNGQLLTSDSSDFLFNEVNY